MRKSVTKVEFCLLSYVKQWTHHMNPTLSWSSNMRLFSVMLPNFLITTFPIKWCCCLISRTCHFISLSRTMTTMKNNQTITNMFFSSVWVNKMSNEIHKTVINSPVMFLCCHFGYSSTKGVIPNSCTIWQSCHNSCFVAWALNNITVTVTWVAVTQMIPLMQEGYMCNHS